MSDQKSFKGACHCGAVQYEFSSDLAKVITCNCSMCTKMGWFLTFVPAETFTLISGEEHLTDYQFNKKVVHHLFCDICGVHSFGRGVGPDGKQTVAINLRCVEDVELDKLNAIHVDGKSR